MSCTPPSLRDLRYFRFTYPGLIALGYCPMPLRGVVGRQPFLLTRRVRLIRRLDFLWLVALGGRSTSRSVQESGGYFFGFFADFAEGADTGRAASFARTGGEEFA